MKLTISVKKPAVLIAALLIGVFVIYLAVNIDLCRIGFLATLFGKECSSEVEIVDTKVIVLGIKDLALLETARSDILIEQTAKRDNRFTPDTVLDIRYIGRVTMGIDMAQITNEDIVVMADNQVSIQLPPIQITGCYLQEPEILTWECGYIVWGGGQCDDKLNELQDVLYEAGLAELLLKTEQLNLADNAYANAETQIYDLVSGMG